MSILSFVQAWQSPLALALLLVLPKLVRLVTQRPTQPAAISPPLSDTAKFLLAAHTILYLKSLVFPPYDIFVHHGLPILASNKGLRASVVPEGVDEETLSPLLELLLTRLKLLDNRMLYARLGHQPLSECLWCTQPADYFLFALPGMLRPYIITGLFVGAVSWLCSSDARRKEWRATVAWALVGGFVGEVGVKWGWDLAVADGDCAHLATTIHTLRALYLLALPLVYAFVPLSSSPSPSPQTILGQLKSLQQLSQFGSLTRLSILQSPVLLPGYAGAWGRQGATAERARRDRGVAVSVSKAGLEEGRLRSEGRSMAGRTWERLVQ
ncbi:hypothetical protein L198_04164 [Cryptococcus wingfieldii CBS 7118]|uniref:Uncharacterized protein n=1 Tax=Cryptococcus wingfieldii CBS 7118 TaxID=1295528 RepID=A0A1E3J6G0_9TREE|nr:hypothetical protein L198_04164 [Cryptococcus wingfieldii CBS 7118]ODN96450.1 hypothetical protein L198_04164 [Cryptococcus wingfieldii CBS 7118]